MKKIIVLQVLVLMSSCFFTGMAVAYHYPRETQSKERAFSVKTPLEIYFSPKGGCTEAICGVIKQAKTEILIQAYSFTSKPILEALIEAQKRGVTIKVIVDKGQQGASYCIGIDLQKLGVPVKADCKHAISHNKIIIVDQKIVVTGSFNFSKNAELSNAENLLIIMDEKVAKKYITNWEVHDNHSDDYKYTPSEKHSESE